MKATDVSKLRDIVTELMRDEEASYFFMVYNPKTDAMDFTAEANGDWWHLGAQVGKCIFGLGYMHAQKGGDDDGSNLSDL